MGLRTAFNSWGSYPAKDWFPFENGTNFRVTIPYDNCDAMVLDGRGELLNGHSHFTISWGDGTCSTYSRTDIYYRHIYNKGTYSISISDDFSKAHRIGFPNFHIELVSIGKSLTNCTHMFYERDKMFGEIPPLPTNLVNGRCMFYGCSGLTGKLPVMPPNIEDVREMFKNCSGLRGIEGTVGSYMDKPYMTDESLYRDMVAGCDSSVTNHFTSNFGEPMQVCLAPDTLITIADGSCKRIDAIALGDTLLAVDPDTGELTTDIVNYTDSACEKWHDSKDVWTFSDGTTITTVKPHQFYNMRTQKMEYIADFLIGDAIRKADGTTPTLTAHEHIEERTRHNTLYTARFNNYFANGILTGNRHSVKWGWEWMNKNSRQ